MQDGGLQRRRAGLDPTERLVAAGVNPGMGIPLWVGEPGYEAFNDVDSSRAVAAGLVPAVTETIRDTLAWDLGRGDPPRAKRAWPPPRRTVVRQLAG